MELSTATMVGVKEFGLIALWKGEGYFEDITWAHPTELLDPVQFLQPRNMVITGGSQLVGRGAHEFDSYIERLKNHGILSLAFGADVYFEGTPEALIDACRKYDLSLIEIPYELPGMALTRWVADTQAAQTRVRDNWVIETMHSLSLAALRRDGISSVLRELSIRLNLGVFLVDSSGEVRYAFNSGQDNEEQFQRILSARELLSRNQRAGKEVVVNGQNVHLQTLGKQQNLSGVLGIVTQDKLNRAELSIVTSAIALAELSLEQSERLRQASGLLRSEIIGFLCDGHVDAALKVSGLIGTRLPDDPIMVALLSSGKYSAPAIELFIIQMKIFSDKPYFPARIEDQMALVISENELDILKKFVKHYDLRAGTSVVGTYQYFQKHLDQSRYALNHARDGRLVRYQPEMEDTIVTLLGKPVIERLTRLKLTPLLEQPDGEQLAESLKIWLDHNGSWDRASRVLGIHRHSLRNRISKIEQLMQIDLNEFENRAFLWTLLKFS